MILLIVINVILLAVILICHFSIRRKDGNARLWDPVSTYGAVAALSSIYCAGEYFLGGWYMFDDIRTAGDINPTIVDGSLLYMLPYFFGCIGFSLIAITLGIIGYNCFRNTRLRVFSKLVILFGVLPVQMIFVHFLFLMFYQTGGFSTL